MEFNSFAFLLFFLGVLFTYHVVPDHRKSALLLLASFAFYGHWQPLFLSVLVAVASIAFLTGLAMERTPGKRHRVMWSGVIAILVILGLFKYASFFSNSILFLAGDTLSAHAINRLNALLPIGISFYSFQALSYIMDAYRGKVKVELDPKALGLYLAFFPQILAGPIERPATLLPQLKALKPFQAEHVLAGLKRMLWGFACKLLVADQLAPIVDGVFADVAGHGGITILLATYLFGFQIYFDFLGYTHIAMGAAQMMGITLSRNFNVPYAAHSLRDFWHRWHITLSRWFRDYVYIPLGGNRTSAHRHVLAILAVFSLSGLWHGASWTFVIWGSLHGVAYLMETVISRWGKGAAFQTKISRRVGQIATFNAVMLLWLPFRSDSVAELHQAVQGIFSVPIQQQDTATEILALVHGNGSLLAAILTLLIAALILDARNGIERFIQRPLAEKVTSTELLTWDAILILLLLMGDLGGSQFVYFRF